MGEQELETADDFSRVGRVNAMLARRLELLAQVRENPRRAPRSFESSKRGRRAHASAHSAVHSLARG